MPIAASKLVMQYSDHNLLLNITSQTNHIWVYAGKQEKINKKVRSNSERNAVILSRIVNVSVMMKL